MPQESVDLEINNQLGLHARPASAFVRVASSFDAEIVVEKDGEAVNGKSLIGLLMLAAGYRSNIKITANGEDANEALSALRNLVANDNEFNQE